MSTDDEKVLLWAAIEDDAGLWETEWELRAVHPDWADARVRERARDLLMQFLEADLVRLFRCQLLEGRRVEIDRAEAVEMLAASASWDPAGHDEPSIRVAATEAGEAFYARMD
ncbi:MAG TPA: hypothetical protein VNT31_11740 [Nocardioides sp.]|nr:hypothetical protein [Nocardioides sp.]